MADHRSIAVFGSSEAVAGGPLYEEARRVGALLAEAGYRVVTGGYGGVMEAASKGATEAGGQTLGVISSIFGGRRPNPYLSRTIETETLHERTRVLIEAALGYVVLWGKSGTLAEVALVWALMRSGSLDARPVLLLGGAWDRLLQLLVTEGMLEAPELRATRVVLSPDEVVATLRELARSSGRT